MEEFHVGQKVKVKQWDTMVAQYGVNSVGNIDLPCPFVTSMKHMCGKTYTITLIDAYIQLGDELDWVFTPEMLECIKPGIRRSL